MLTGVAAAGSSLLSQHDPPLAVPQSAVTGSCPCHQPITPDSMKTAAVTKVKGHDSSEVRARGHDRDERRESNLELTAATLQVSSVCVVSVVQF